MFQKYVMFYNLFSIIWMIKHITTASNINCEIDINDINHDTVVMTTIKSITTILTG